MNHRISTCLWLNEEAEEAAKLYTSIFENSKIGQIAYYSEVGKEHHGKEEGSVMTIDIELPGQRVILLNGGPHFNLTPAISYYVTLESEEQVNKTWNTLLEGGKVLMPLDKYDWSQKYGWLQDRYGVSWQISLGKIEDVGQQICPLLFFTGRQKGRAEEALRCFTTIFQPSHVDGILYYGKEGPGEEGTVMHAQFGMCGHKFMVMDSATDDEHLFNEAFSLEVCCESQEEVDRYWNYLLEGGEEQMCGWLKDRFGISWQIVPRKLYELLDTGSEEQHKRVMAAMFGMKKLDINGLQQAYDQG